MPAFANSVDPDQLASSAANWSGSSLFVIQHMNLYNDLNQVIWLADILKRVWRLNLFKSVLILIDSEDLGQKWLE